MLKIYSLPEILAPAGNLEKCAIAFYYGADAVYLGGKKLNLRAACDGFSFQDLIEAKKIAQSHQGKIYFTLNALPMEDDIHSIEQEIEIAAKAEVDAFIIADPGVIHLAKKIAPHIPIHLSTQANTTNSAAINYWKEQGVSRVNLARELSQKTIGKIKEKCPDIELEVFVHGAMCLAVSGQCLMSAWLNQRHANLGECTHPCRFEYKPIQYGPLYSEEHGQYQQATLGVAERKRESELVWEITEESQYSKIWAPQDLCLLAYLPWFIKTGITSLKIEGRVKGSSYLAYAVDIYKTALSFAAKSLESEEVYSPTMFYEELEHIISRPIGTGFFLDGTRELIRSPKEKNKKSIVAKISKESSTKNLWEIDVRSNFYANCDFEILLPGMQRIQVKSGSFELFAASGAKVDKLSSGLKGFLKTDNTYFQIDAFLRQEKDLS